MHAPGLLLRIDVAKAMTDPAHAGVAALPAGCNPVRVAVSPSGKQIWVTARGDNALLRFQADDWVVGTTQASYTNFPIGSNPVGVVVRPDGKQVWAALSNRFGKDKDNAGRLAGLAIGASDSSMKLMSAPAAGFPREVTFLPDGRTLIATLFDAKQVEFIPTPD
jgi:DNA-binding beta-propeller fold protein YncE